MALLTAVSSSEDEDLRCFRAAAGVPERDFKARPFVTPFRLPRAARAVVVEAASSEAFDDGAALGSRATRLFALRVLMSARGISLDCGSRGAARPCGRFAGLFARSAVERDAFATAFFLPLRLDGGETGGGRGVGGADADADVSIEVAGGP